ncbi:MAG: thioredoxin [Thermoleophilia bacterium]|nr:thioredoxin [Thermoleophilia bacterium]MDH4339052.1 thioredoxin [Thermoleophilia bacterium]
MAINVTEATFEQEVLNSETPVIVDFWAEWCGPCHAVAPVLEKIAEERGDGIKLVKVNIDEEQALSIKYGVMSIPTMILFKEGEPAAAAVGAQPKSALERSLGLAA